MLLVDFPGQIRAEKVIASEAIKVSSTVAPRLEDSPRLKILPVISKHPNTVGNYKQSATKCMAVYPVRSVRRLQRRGLASSKSEEKDASGTGIISIQSPQAAAHDANSDGLADFHRDAECRGSHPISTA